MLRDMAIRGDVADLSFNSAHRGVTIRGAWRSEIRGRGRSPAPTSRFTAGEAGRGRQRCGGDGAPRTPTSNMRASGRGFDRPRPGRGGGWRSLEPLSAQYELPGVRRCDGAAVVQGAARFEGGSKDFIWKPKTSRVVLCRFYWLPRENVHGRHSPNIAGADNSGDVKARMD